MGDAEWAPSRAQRKGRGAHCSAPCNGPWGWVERARLGCSAAGPVATLLQCSHQFLLHLHQALNPGPPQGQEIF